MTGRPFPFDLVGVVRLRFPLDADETRNVHFPTFLANCIIGRHAGYNDNTFWDKIIGGVYIPSTARGEMTSSTT